RTTIQKSGIAGWVGCPRNTLVWSAGMSRLLLSGCHAFVLDEAQDELRLGATEVQDLMCRYLVAKHIIDFLQRYLVAKHIIDFLQRLRSVGSSRRAGGSDCTPRS